jgi:AraC-like DNA-binding protein
VRPLLDHLDRRDRAKRIPAVDRTRALLHDATLLIPLVGAGALFERAARSEGTDVGLRAALETRPLSFGEWGAVIESSPTLGSFLTRMTIASRRFNSGQRIWWEERGEEIRVHQHFCRHLVEGRGPLTEFAFGMLLQGLRLAMGPDWRPLEIHLGGAPPPHAAALAAQAARQIRFRQPHTVVVFPKDLLSRRLPVSSGERRTLSPAPQPADTFEGSVRQTIESLVRLGEPELSATARAAQMSERSLQRRLAEHGLRFARLVEEARFEAAQRLLREPGRKIVDVSLALGYTDSANFTRAFRRWAGVPPQAFRQVG